MYVLMMSFCGSVPRALWGEEGCRFCHRYGASDERPGLVRGPRVLHGPCVKEVPVLVLALQDSQAWLRLRICLRVKGPYFLSILLLPVLHL